MLNLLLELISALEMELDLCLKTEEEKEEQQATEINCFITHIILIFLIDQDKVSFFPLPGIIH